MPRFPLVSLFGLSAWLSAAGLIFMLVMGHTDAMRLGVAVLSGAVVALGTAPVLVWSRG